MRCLAISIFCILVGLLAWSCGSSEGDSGRNKKPATDNNIDSDNSDDEDDVTVSADKHTVLVIDDGFDTTHPVFKNRIKAEYTITCKTADPEDQPTDLEALKQALIEQYGQQDSSCTVSENIAFELPDEFNSIENQKDDWNQAVMSKSSAIANSNYEDLYQIITGQETESNFHGTNTSGLIAYQNDRVELILVQMELGSAGDAIINDDTECPKQDEIDLWVEAHLDDNVKEAHKKAPVSAVVSKLVEIIDEENVSLVNLSLGSYTSEGLANKLADEGCGNLDFTSQYATEGQLNRERELYRIENELYQATNYLTVQAAGNEGRKIDSLSDAAECSDKEVGLIIAGSYDYDGNVSEFSNFGDCVDFFTLGANVVTAAPAGFLNVVNGTSFSAPLLVRYISTNFPVSTDFTSIIIGLENSVGLDKKLPKATFPEEVAFQSTKEIGNYTLTQSQRSDVSQVPLQLLRRKLRGFKYGYSQPDIKLRSFSIAR
jgi:hypothetical protein